MSQSVKAVIDFHDRVNAIRNTLNSLDAKSVDKAAQDIAIIFLELADMQTSGLIDLDALTEAEQLIFFRAVARLSALMGAVLLLKK